MDETRRIAFVDLETTGLDPAADRVTEIAIITVDGTGVEEWSTLVNPRRDRREFSGLPGVDPEEVEAAPRFRDIAREAAARLSGRLLVAHNARFDHAFLKAEFERAGIPFYPDVLCSVMLSRKLYAGCARHDLDAVIARHGLTAGVRHRALSDARALRQFWEAMRREHPQAVIDDAIRGLRAGPVLPAHLNPALIDRLPDAPGVFVLHAGEQALHVGTAGNLRLRLVEYFRIDRSSPRALATSHLVTHITWRVTRGRFGAQLLREVMAGALVPARYTGAAPTPWSWRFDPEADPAVALISLSERDYATPSYGVFDSERKARNALVRLAARHGLCHRLLGIAPGKARACSGCPVHADAGACGHKAGRLQHLARAFSALAALRVEAWPYDGPIGIRERGDLHVLENWRYLGTARDEGEVHSVLAAHPGGFDRNVFRVISKRLARVASRRVLRLSTPAQPGASDRAEP